MLERLPDNADYVDPEPFAGPDHPIRELTVAVANGQPWTREHAERITGLFDGLAPEWAKRQADPLRRSPVADVLDRGDVPLDGDWLEIGSGTGAGAEVLAGRVPSLVVTDLSMEMLATAPAEVAPRVRSDASALPFPDDSFDALLLVNMMLFPTEVDRVLRADGTVVWVNTRGDQTPIHLPPDHVLAALPGDWDGRTARSGTGFWLAGWRA